jgi:hypothetical protein
MLLSGLLDIMHGMLANPVLNLVMITKFNHSSHPCLCQRVNALTHQLDTMTSPLQ